MAQKRSALKKVALVVTENLRHGQIQKPKTCSDTSWKHHCLRCPFLPGGAGFPVALKKAIVFSSPSDSGTAGSHFRSARARVISGCRKRGSSCGRGLCVILLRE